MPHSLVPAPAPAPFPSLSHYPSPSTPSPFHLFSRDDAHVVMKVVFIILLVLLLLRLDSLHEAALTLRLRLPPSP